MPFLVTDFLGVGSEDLRQTVLMQTAEGEIKLADRECKDKDKTFAFSGAVHHLLNKYSIVN